MDALLGQFQADQRVHHQGWLELQGRPPRRLHHYTTIDGLVGIVTSNSLWASDVRFMNDSSELTYAATLIEEVIEEVLAEASHELVSSLLPNRASLANSFEYGSRPFVACFCEKEDLLSQWRGYGVGQAPVSLGLDLSHFMPGFGLPSNTFLRKVIYNPETQRQTVRSVVETWVSTIETLLNQSGGPQQKDVLPYPAIWALQQALAEHHLCYKHPTFEEEQEWRLIKLIDVREEFRLLDDRRMEAMMEASRQRMKEMGVDMPDYPTYRNTANAEGIEIGFRTSAMGLVPYVELPLIERAGVFSGRLPLWQVVQGPTAHPDLSMQSLHMFLESRGYGFHTEVRLSGIPLRS